jgi:hypothetical protein
MVSKDVKPVVKAKDVVIILFLEEVLDYEITVNLFDYGYLFKPN